MSNRTIFILLTLFVTVGFASITLWPDDAEARRFGGGSSFGSRGSRSFSTPRQAVSTPRASTVLPSTPMASPSAMPGRSGLSSGLMGGLGGLMLGGLLGSMLFGGGGGGEAMGEAAGAAGGMGGSGIGLFEILLFAGLIWFAFRWFKQKRERESVPVGGKYSASRESMAQAFGDSTFVPNSGSFSGGSMNETDQGLDSILAMDPAFNERQFLEGAKMAFQQIQGAWSDWSVDRLRPLLTLRMWEMIQAQAEERKAAGRRDIIEKIRFDNAVISEAWQETGEDWITVHFMVNMVDYTTDALGTVVEGNPSVHSTIEEYWTFTRPIGNSDPNWFLAAIQQPGEVARTAR